MKVIKDILTDYEINNSKSEKLKIQIGYRDIDFLIKGLNKYNLIVIGSRPAMGKTSFALNVAVNVAVKQEKTVAIFSLENSAIECVNRILSIEAMVNTEKIRDNKFDENEANKIKNAKNELENKSIYIDDTPAMSLNDIREKCIKLKQEKNIELIIIDYLQLISYIDKRNACLELKKLSQKLDIPIMVISQLNKGPQYRYKRGEDPAPILSDINNEVVRNADLLLFLHRDDYYNEDTEKKDIATIKTAINKYGNIGEVELLWMSSYLKFVDLLERQDTIINENAMEKHIKYIKEHTNWFETINIQDIKKIEENYWNNTYVILLKNGDLYIDGICIAKNIKDIYSLENGEMFEIKNDNSIMPIKELEEWDDLDMYLYNDGEPYKKIIYDNGDIVGLTQENKVVAVTFWGLYGVIAENFIEVDDIFFKENKGIYVLKNEEEKPLFVHAIW